MALKRGIEAAAAKVVGEVKKISKPATGDVIAQIGAITVKESKTMVAELETVECSSTAVTCRRTS